uniref:Uncharacterized protein n=1 Tax=Arundo donax TaxID=35708 RepID=A0A0A9F292_ARUDO
MEMAEKGNLVVANKSNNNILAKTIIQVHQREQ